MEESIPSYASSDSFVLVIVSIVLAIFGIVVGFQIGAEIAKRVTSKKEYLQKSAIAYGIAILVSAGIWATGYVVLSFITIGALGGLIAGLSFNAVDKIAPFRAAHAFAGRKKRGSREEEEPQDKKSGKDEGKDE